MYPGFPLRGLDMRLFLARLRSTESGDFAGTKLISNPCVKAEVCTSTSAVSISTDIEFIVVWLYSKMYFIRLRAFLHVDDASSHDVCGKVIVFVKVSPFESVNLVTSIGIALFKMLVCQVVPRTTDPFVFSTDEAKCKTTQWHAESSSPPS